MTSTGIAAPPDTHSRRVPTSALSRPGWLSSAWYIVGTPSKMVTLSRPDDLQRLARLEAGIIVRQAPIFTLALSPQVWPKEWKERQCSQQHVLGLAVEQRPHRDLAVAVEVAWVSSAPFGVPVVPEV
jgi:hypothetical protein